VVEVCLKPIHIAQRFAQPFHVLVLQLLDTLAPLADQVVVRRRSRPFVVQVAGAHVRLGDEPQILQRGERAVHRRDIDVRIRLPHLGKDLACRGVAIAVAQRRQHHQPLWCDLLTSPPEDGNRLVIAAHE
jgi:hypothetical protein